MTPVLLALVGPTAVGKTALAVSLAAHYSLEAISVDSRQCYRYMDIGTAKPTPEERARLPHQLIDIADPNETVGLAQFLDLARAAIADIHARGNIPLLVGGTGQYMRALLQGWQAPEVVPDPALRAALEARSAESLWAQLMELDPYVAEFLDRRNVRRVIRALEVCLATGQPFSEQRRRDPPPFPTLQLGLTLERDALYTRADTRVTAMLKAGLLDEVGALLKAGYGWKLPAMSGLGYAQFRPYFAGQATLDEVAARICWDTHDFIRRQYTWFSLNDPAIHWLDAGNPVPAAVQCVEDFLRLQVRPSANSVP